MGNADSKSLEHYQLQALLEEAAAPVDVSDDAGAGTDIHSQEAASGGSRLKKFLEGNFSSKEIAAVLGTRENIQHLVMHHSQALLCLLDQLIALVSATADAALQTPITPAQSSTLLTALRLLSLLVPVLLESRELEQLLFWTPHPRCPRACNSSSSSAASSRRASTKAAAALQEHRQDGRKADYGGAEPDEDESGEREGQSGKRKEQQSHQEPNATGEEVVQAGCERDAEGEKSVDAEVKEDVDRQPPAAADYAAETSATAADPAAVAAASTIAAAPQQGESSSTAASFSDSSAESGKTASAEDARPSIAAAVEIEDEGRNVGYTVAAAEADGSATPSPHPDAPLNARQANALPAVDQPAAAPAASSPAISTVAYECAVSRGEKQGGAGAAVTSGLLRGSTTVGHDIVNQLFRMLFLPGFTVTPGCRLVSSVASSAAGGAAGGEGENLLARLPRHKLDVPLLWRAGIGATEADLPSAFSRVPSWMANNRVEVIHCLLACFAGPLYGTLDDYQVHIPQWVRVATAGNAPYTANLFCSLLSTACAADAVGSGRMLGLFGSLESQTLTTAVVQLLIVLLDFHTTVFVNPDDRSYPVRVEGACPYEEEHFAAFFLLLGVRRHRVIGGGKRGQNGLPLRNVFRSMVIGLQREEEFDFIYDGIVRHLEAAVARCCRGAGRAAAIGSTGKPDLFCEQLLILTWQLLTLNGRFLIKEEKQASGKTKMMMRHFVLAKFLRHICAKRGAHHLLHPLACLLLDASRHLHRQRQPQQRKGGDESSNSNSSKARSAGGGDEELNEQTARVVGSSGEAANALSMIGLLHMSSFILLVLSSERDFAVQLNEPFTGKKIPAELPVFNGCYADLLCLTVHRIIIDATVPRGNSESLVDMLLTVLCNVSAYVKSFCLESCMRLMHLMEKLSRRQWLLSAPQHHHDVGFLLDVFNNVVQYQYEGNRQMIYSILRHKQLFLDLQYMTLDGGEGTEAYGGTSRRGRKEANAVSSSSSSSASSEAASFSRAHGEAVVVNGTATGAGSKSSVNTAGDAEENKRENVAENGGEEGEAQDRRSGWNTVATEDDEEESWMPTEAWFEEWKSRLPLQTILRLIKCLLPQVEAEVARREATDQKDILQFLEKTTMVGLLPVPHPIIIRNYQPNVYTALWFTSFMWGVLLAACPALQAVNWREIRLIVVYP